jgi:outer membrane protein TolC
MARRTILPGPSIFRLPMPIARTALSAPLCAWLALSASAALAQAPEASGTPTAPTPGEAASAEPLSLERAVALAAERNETAQAADERARAARARVAQARAFFFPELTATGRYTRRTEETTRNVGGEEVVLQRRNALSAAFNARLPVFNLRGIPLFQAARLQGEAAGLDAVEARRQVSFEAASAFLSTLAQQQVFQAAEQRLTFARKALEDAQARAKAGLASTNDVTRAELEVASAEVDLTNARNSAQTSRLELGYLLVAPVEGALAPPEALLSDAARPPESFNPLLEGAADRRPDILASRLRVKALEANAREPLARLLPSLDAFATYQLTNEGGLNARTTNGFFGLDLTWNLFDGGERYAERRERQALARAAALEEQAGTRRVDVDIQRARVALENAQAALSQSELAVRVARRNAEEQGILYREGLSTALTVADASLQLFEAEVALAQSRYSLGVALLGLRSAVGLNPLGKEP